jgi:hypothetical protein
LEPRCPYIGTTALSVNVFIINIPNLNCGTKIAIHQVDHGGSRMKSSRITFGSKKIDRSTVRNILIGIYVLCVLGLSATARADQQYMPVKPSDKWKVAEYRGTAALTTDGKSYLIVSENEAYLLNSNKDLSQYNGLLVRVVGLGANVEAGKQQEESLVPLTEDEIQPEKPVLNVLEISEDLY